MGLGSGIRDPGSGKNLSRIPDPGVKTAPDPGSGPATLQTAVAGISAAVDITAVAASTAVAGVTACDGVPAVEYNAY
jgi:hypothetical protein